MKDSMKTYRNIAFLLAASLLFSCHGTDPVDPVGPEEPQPETRTLTFTLPSAGEEASAVFKTSWQAGDQIVVHGEYAEKQVVVTLEGSDISSDGKTATKTVEGLFPYVREDCGSTLYASYPASCSDNLRHCFFYSKFNTTNAQLLAAYNEADTFNFQNVCGVMSFNVDGDYDGFSITGLRKETLGYEFIQVKLTDGEQNYRQYIGSPIINVEGSIVDGVATLYIPDGLSFDGCTIKLSKAGKYVAIYKGKDACSFSRGEITSLGDLTEEIEPYDDPFSSDILDLDAQGNANCYIVTEPGVYKFKAVKGNSAISFIENIADAGILWETWNNAEEVEAGSIVKSVSYAEDYMILHMPDVLKAGNAVICAKDIEGTILWSWHIWVPETTIAIDGGSLFGTPAMDRNLGALVAAKAEASPVVPEAFGLMYQWGRKDPFPAGQAISSSSLATVAGAESEKAPGQITLAESIANPTLMGHQDNGDWLKDTDGTLWSDDGKTIYDPCPPGYRVPSSSSNSFWGDLSTGTGWSFDKTNGWFTTGSPAAVFPLCGYQDDYDVTSIAHGYDRGLYWSSAASLEKPGYGRGEDVRPGSSIAFKETPKSRAGCVRCVAE